MAHTKLLSPAGWDMGVPAATMLKLGRDGRLGPNDRSAFEKRAGAAGAHIFDNQLDRLKFAADEIPVHLIALGAKEAWGPNRNGDAFTEATLKAAHDTFVKYAYYFNNHKNKKHEGDPHYGTMKASVYNPQMRRVELLVCLPTTKAAADRLGCNGVDEGALEKLASGLDLPVSMACPRVGTLVKLKRGFRKVEDIRPGDKVLTHRGRYRKVTARLRRTKQQYAKIATRYCGRQSLEFTPEHEFFVARWEDVPKASHRDVPASRDFRRRHRAQLHAHAKWMPCGDLKPGDLLLMPIYRGTGRSPFDRETARVLGYYTAEGSITSDGYLCFTCNKADAAVPELTAWAGERSYSVLEHSASIKAVNFTLYDKIAARIADFCVGRGVRNKVIPEGIYDAPTDVKLEYIAAWFNGDGWQDDKGLHWSTCSRTLSIELQMLLASVGVPASVYRIDHTSDLPDRPRTGDGIEYTVNVSNRYSGVFASRSKAEVIEPAAEKTTVFITGDYLAIPVKSVEVVEEEVEVCDLSVQDDESFTAFGFAVHNCRVPYDVCSACHNKARTRSEYCKAASCPGGGCDENLTRLVKIAGDLHHVHVDNPNPIFFDMSRVWRPADRTAYGGRADYLTKAASDGGFFGVFGVGGAKLAADLGVTPPLHVVLAQDAMLPGEWAPALALRVKLACGLAALDARPEKWASADVAAAFSPKVQPDLDLAALGLDPAAPEKMAAGLGALADRKVVLAMREFARMTKRAELAADAAACLRGVYSRMISDGTLERRLATCPYLPAEKLASAKQREAAGRVVSSHSLEKTAVADRCRLATVRGVAASAKTTFWNEKKAHDSAATEDLARDYACYKAAALARIAEFDDEFPLTTRVAACQNW